MRCVLQHLKSLRRLTIRIAGWWSWVSRHKKAGASRLFCVLSSAQLAPANYAAFLHSARNFWRALPLSFFSSALTEHSFDFAVCAVNCLFGAFFSALAAGAALLAEAGTAGTAAGAAGTAGAALTGTAFGATAAAGAAGAAGAWAKAVLTLKNAVATSAVTVRLREIMGCLCLRWCGVIALKLR